VVANGAEGIETNSKKSIVQENKISLQGGKQRSADSPPQGMNGTVSDPVSIPSNKNRYIDF
jgi:hypothetical protein